MSGIGKVVTGLGGRAAVGGGVSTRGGAVVVAGAAVVGTGAFFGTVDPGVRAGAVTDGTLDADLSW